MGIRGWSDEKENYVPESCTRALVRGSPELNPKSDMRILFLHGILNRHMLRAPCALPALPACPAPCPKISIKSVRIGVSRKCDRVRVFVQLQLIG